MKVKDMQLRSDRRPFLGDIVAIKNDDGYWLAIVREVLSNPELVSMDLLIKDIFKGEDEFSMILGDYGRLAFWVVKNEHHRND